MTAPEPSDLSPPPALNEVARPALFLDLDGTLAAIEPRPQDVRPEPWRTGLIRRLHERLQGRLAVISGRPLDEIDSILEGAAVAVAAVHGLVRRRPDGIVLETPPHPGLADALRALQAVADGHEGLIVEDKGLSIALHFRLHPELGGEVAAEAMRLSGQLGLRLQLGDMVAELCTPGLDKGAAVRAFMAEPPFQGGFPIFVGDDLTDEDAFKAVRALGGLGVLAGPRRPTYARRRLGGADAVRAWLEASLAPERALP